MGIEFSEEEMAAFMTLKPVFLIIDEKDREIDRELFALIDDNDRFTSVDVLDSFIERYTEMGDHDMVEALSQVQAAFELIVAAEESHPSAVPPKNLVNPPKRGR